MLTILLAAAPVDGVEVPAKILHFPWLWPALVTAAAFVYAVARVRRNRLDRAKAAEQGYYGPITPDPMGPMIVVLMVIIAWFVAAVAGELSAIHQRRDALADRVESAYGVTLAQRDQLPTTSGGWSEPSSQVDIIEDGKSITCTAVVTDWDRLYLTCPEPADG